MNDITEHFSFNQLYPSTVQKVKVVVTSPVTYFDLNTKVVPELCGLIYE